MIILEFQTESDAENTLDQINDFLFQYLKNQGYTVVDEENNNTVIGKNALTGQDDPHAQVTTTWDIVRQSPDGTFYFSSLSNDPRFINWTGSLSLVNYVEKPFPDSWEPKDVF